MVNRQTIDTIVKKIQIVIASFQHVLILQTTSLQTVSWNG